MAGDTRSTARRPATEGGAPARVARLAEAPRLRLEFREEARAADPSRAPNGSAPSAGAGLLGARAIVGNVTPMPFEPQPPGSSKTPPSPHRHLGLIRNPMRHAAEVIHAGEREGGDSDTSTSSSSPPHAFFVVRALDVDRRGRCLVGVESGPHQTLPYAVAFLRVIPHYGPSGMADELIMLARDVIVLRDDAAASMAGDGGARFIITGEDRVASIKKSGAWEVDLASIRHAENERQEAAENAAAEALASAAGAFSKEKERERVKEKTTTRTTSPKNDDPAEAREEGGNAGTSDRQGRTIVANDDRANGAGETTVSEKIGDSDRSARRNAPRHTRRSPRPRQRPRLDCPRGLSRRPRRRPSSRRRLRSYRSCPPRFWAATPRWCPLRPRSTRTIPSAAR